jgi:hypothetical protein
MHVACLVGLDGTAERRSFRHVEQLTVVAELAVGPGVVGVAVVAGAWLGDRAVGHLLDGCCRQGRCAIETFSYYRSEYPWGPLYQVHSMKMEIFVCASLIIPPTGLKFV